MTQKRILFVDDEPQVLAGLKRMLRRQRDEWEMVFVCSGHEALEMLAGAHFDVIVTDMRMPVMNGAELLERVVQNHPDTARIVLSGHAEEELAKRALGVTHLYLCKPTDAETLKQAVGRACSAQETVSSDRIRAIVGGCDTLPSLPTLYLQITTAAGSVTAGAKEISEIIARDMGMSAKILQIVNSSFFGIGRRIANIQQTVSLLGIDRIKALVLSEHVFKEFSGASIFPGFSLDRIWEHSLIVADVARAISRQEAMSKDEADQCFTAGILLDVGTLILASQQPGLFRQVLEQAQAEKAQLYDVEDEMLGTNHAQVGAYLLELWGLPPPVVDAVRHHHVPSEGDPVSPQAVAVVHAADALVHEVCPMVPDDLVNVMTSRLDLAHFENVGLAARLEDWGALVADICAKVTEPVT